MPAAASHTPAGPATRLQHWLRRGAWALPLLSLAVAAGILWVQQRGLLALQEQLAAKNQLRVRVMADALVRHLSHVGITLRTISTEPSVRRLQTDSRDYIAEIYEQNYAHHRLAEVYIIERDFDASGRPFMTFEHSEGDTPPGLVHSPAHEAAEYALQREHIRRFAADPGLTDQLSPPLMLCIGQPGVVYSVPIRDNGQFRGIVAGMIPASILAELIATGDRGEGVVLLGGDGGRGLSPQAGVIVQHAVRPEVVAAVRSAFVPEHTATVIPPAPLDAAPPQAGAPRAPSDASNAQSDASRAPFGARRARLGALEALCEPVAIPQSAPWRLVHLYDPAAQLGALGVATTAPGVGIASIVVLLGILAGVLCHTAAELIRARRTALARAEELSHVERVSTMNELAAGLAHEINQPLTAIATYAEACVCRAQNGQRLDPEFLSDLAAISGQAERATGIVDRLRRFVARRPAPRDLADLNALVRESVQLLDAAIREAKVEVRLRLAPELPPVYVDAVQIVQVLVNLQRNAIEALQEQPAEARHMTVETLSTAQHEVEVAVEDRGNGLSDAELAALFTPLRSAKPHGLGLGLSISRTIVEAHGGRLAASRGAAGGMRFVFTLPAAEDVAPGRSRNK